MKIPILQGLFACHNNENLIISIGLIVFTVSQIGLSHRSRAIYYKASCANWAEIELIRGSIACLVNCNNEYDPIKNVGARTVTTFSPL